MEIIDLTYDIEEDMSIFNAPWHSQVKISQLGRIDYEGRETRIVCLGTHSGTHMDAPLHFIQGGNTIEQIPLQKLIGSVSIIDFSHLKKNEIITRKMLKEIEIVPRMIFYFGWGKYWKTKHFFKDYPYFSIDAVKYLISKKIEVLGMDTPSPDDSRINICDPDLDKEKDSPIHKLLLNQGIIIIEYISNLNKVNETEGWTLVALPLKIKGADGAPIRICLIK